MSGQEAPIEAAEISLWRLHYGKLVSGATLRVPDSEGYRVTRRTLGLPPEEDGLLSPLRMIGLKRLEPELIDAAAQEKGFLVARCDGSRVSFLRARFRPEDGDDGHDRLYHQSAVWIGDALDWRRHPFGLLAIASEDIVAAPDLVDEDEAARFGETPLRYRLRPVDPAEVRRALENAYDRTSWAKPLLNFLAENGEADADADLTFGYEHFASESDFLAAVGLALALLSQDYPRWNDIAVVSGLRHKLPGLCLRYLPSGEVVEQPVETSAAA